MGKRLFVGNLSWDTQEDDLIAAFEKDGRSVASARIMTDRDTGRPRGFAFVEFADDGSAYSLKSLGGKLEVPVGRYALGSVTMTIDTGDKEPWHFVFSRYAAVRKKDWIEVAAGKTASIEAIGNPRFQLEVSGSGNAEPGANVVVNPRLYTQDGLLINLSCRGRQIGSFDRDRFHNRCDIRLSTTSGNTLSSAQSGFA